MPRPRRGERVHYLYFNGVLIWVYSVYLSWLNIYFSDHITDMTFMDSEREIEREAHLREQASKMWEEAKRRSEERRRWREANMRTMGATSGRYENRKERTNTGKKRRRRRREHRYTHVDNARLPQIDLGNRLPPRRQCKCSKLFDLKYLRTVLCKRMQQLSPIMRPAHKNMQRYVQTDETGNLGNIQQCCVCLWGTYYKWLTINKLY